MRIPDTVKEIEPSPTCPVGTRGRVAVFEMFEMDKELEQIILNNASELSIGKHLRSKGMFSMKEDALLKVFAGKVPFEEVNKL